MKWKINLPNWLIPVLIGMVGYALLHFYTRPNRILSEGKRESEEHIDATIALMQKAIDVGEPKNTDQLENQAKQSSAESQQTQDKLRMEKEESKEAPETDSGSTARSAKGEKRPLAMSEDTPAIGNRLVIQRSAIALGVENREPKGVSERVSVRDGRVYCWVHTSNGKGEEITIRWISRGEMFAEERLLIGGDNWRTWTYTTLRPGMVGPAQADILNEEGQLLQSIAFEIID